MCMTCGCDELPAHQQTLGDSHHQDKQQTEIKLAIAILAENAAFASRNRQIFANKKTLALNLLSSPGSGKTALLEATIKSLSTEYPLYVIEGDQHTKLDAQRIRSAGAEAYQINTGKTCHLDGHMVSHALEHMNILPQGFIFIENVGNLICPALFDLGEHAKVVIIAVTEGEDKPLKYPDMFYAADLVIINKIDLLPYLEFNIDECINNIKKINSRARIIQLSAYQQNGIEQWINWLHSAQQFYLG